MRTLAFLLLLMLPLAAASGPYADVRTLTDSSSCQGQSSGSGDSTSWYDPGSSDDNFTFEPPTQGGSGWSQASESRACSHESQAVGADVGDGAGSLASASVYQENASGSSHESGGSYDYGYRYSGAGWVGSSHDHGTSNSTWTSSDARGASARVLGADAGERSGCSDRASTSQTWDYEQDSYWDGTSSNDGRASSASQDQSACGDLVSAGDAGHGAFAGDASGCSNSASGHSSWWSSGSGGNASSASQETRNSSSSCRSGLVADADGMGVFAGNEQTCRSTSGSSSSSWSPSWNGSAQQCENDYAVEGPDGIRVAQEHQDGAYSSCTGGSCSQDSWQSDQLAWTWADSPVGALQGGAMADSPPTVLP